MGITSSVIFPFKICGYNDNKGSGINTQELFIKNALNSYVHKQNFLVERNTAMREQSDE